MRRFLLLFLVFVGCAALLIGTAHVGEATLMLRLDDWNTNTTVIATDTDSDGVVSFSGNVGSYIVNVTTGLSKPLIGNPNLARIDLNSINVSGGSGTLLLWLTDTDFTLLNQGLLDLTLTNTWGGTTDGTVRAQGYLGTTNVEFGGSGYSTGLQGPMGPGAFADSVSTTIAAGALSAGQQFNLTEKVWISHTAPGQVTSFDKSLTAAVPEPSTLLLLGSGLLGLAGIGRRKFRK